MNYLMKEENNKQKSIETNDNMSLGIIGCGTVFVGVKNTDH